MPRNASGNYTLPLPSVVTGTVIESLWANTTMNDLASSVTDSLDRYGRGGMVAPFRMVDGAVSTPAISFTGETNTGLYRPSAGVISVSVLGAEKQTWTSAGTTIGGDLNLLGDINILGEFEIDGNLRLEDTRSIVWGGSGFNTYISGSDATDAIVFATNGLERMRLDVNGNMGLGTGAPNAQTRLHVKGNVEILRLETTSAIGNNFLTFWGPSARKGWVGYGNPTDDNLFITQELNAHMHFLVNGGTRMSIDPVGRVGINAVPAAGIMLNIGGVASVAVTDNLCGILGTPIATDFFTVDTNKQIASYGLAWKLFSTFPGGAMGVLSGYGGLKFFAGNVERVFIAFSGEVGMGFSPTANYRLDVNGTIRSVGGEATTGYGVRVLNSTGNGGGSITAGAGANNGMTVGSDGGPLIFAAQGAERGRVVGGALVVGYVTGGYQNVSAQSLEGPTGYAVFNHVAGTGNGTAYCHFGYAGGGAGQIYQATTGSVVYATTCDESIKTAIEDLPDVGALIDALRPRRFEYKLEPGDKYRGFIAQELYTVMPEAVYTGTDPANPRWGADYSVLVPLLVRELQSLRARVAALGG